MFKGSRHNYDNQPNCWLSLKVRRSRKNVGFSIQSQ